MSIARKTPDRACCPVTARRRLQCREFFRPWSVGSCFRFPCPRHTLGLSTSLKWGIRRLFPAALPDRGTSRWLPHLHRSILRLACRTPRTGVLCTREPSVPISPTRRLSGRHWLPRRVKPPTVRLSGWTNRSRRTRTRCRAEMPMVPGAVRARVRSILALARGKFELPACARKAIMSGL